MYMRSSFVFQERSQEVWFWRSWGVRCRRSYQHRRRQGQRAWCTNICVQENRLELQFETQAVKGILHRGPKELSHHAVHNKVSSQHTDFVCIVCALPLSMRVHACGISWIYMMQIWKKCSCHVTLLQKFGRTAERKSQRTCFYGKLNLNEMPTGLNKRRPVHIVGARQGSK